MTTPQEPTQMTAPTREQVIKWAKDAGFGAYGLGLIEDGAAPEVANLCAIVMAAARAQALDEAAMSARTLGIDGIPIHADDIVADWLEALKGKQ